MPNIQRTDRGLFSWKTIILSLFFSSYERGCFKFVALLQYFVKPVCEYEMCVERVMCMCIQLREKSDWEIGRTFSLCQFGKLEISFFVC